MIQISLFAYFIMQISRNTDIKNRCVDIRWEKKWEVDICALPYVKEIARRNFMYSTGSLVQFSMMT